MMSCSYFRYEESNLKVARKKTNLMFIGDGKGKTIITGGKNVAQKMTTFHTATFGKFRQISSSFHVINFESLSIFFMVTNNMWALSLTTMHGISYYLHVAGYANRSYSV